MFYCITKSYSIISFYKTSIVVLDSLICLILTSSIVLLVVGLYLNKCLKVVWTLLFSMCPEHPDKTTVFPVYSLINPTFTVNFFQGLIRDSSLKIFVISVDSSEFFKEKDLTLLLMVDSDLFP